MLQSSTLVCSHFTYACGQGGEDVNLMLFYFPAAVAPILYWWKLDSIVRNEKNRTFFLPLSTL